MIIAVQLSLPEERWTFDGRTLREEIPDETPPVSLPFAVDEIALNLENAVVDQRVVHVAVDPCRVAAIEDYPASVEPHRLFGAVGCRLGSLGFAGADQNG